jgi:hypothetical protein
MQIYHLSHEQWIVLARYLLISRKKIHQLFSELKLCFMAESSRSISFH